MPDVHEMVVDPYLLCLPNPCTTADQLVNFISSLLGWGGLLSRGDACVLLADSARIALSDDDEYPHWHKLSKLLTQYQCEIADVKTISDLADGILKRSPCFEDYYGIDVIVVDENKTYIQPSQLLDRLKKNCRTSFSEVLASILILRQLKSKDHRDSVLVASAIGGGIVAPLPDEISVTSEVQISFSTEICDELPINVADKIPVSFKHDELSIQLDVWDLWDNASSNESAVSAIELCIQNLVEAGVNSVAKVQYTLGSNFLGSARTWGAGKRSDYAMIIIESCARIVLGIPKNQLNEFRVDSKSTSAQRKRDNDGALAFRTHLTKKGAGLRLMFWKLPSGVIEFANIGDKDELEIL